MPDIIIRVTSIAPLNPHITGKVEMNIEAIEATNGVYIGRTFNLDIGASASQINAAIESNAIAEFANLGVIVTGSDKKNII